MQPPPAEEGALLLCRPLELHALYFWVCLQQHADCCILCGIKGLCGVCGVCAMCVRVCARRDAKVLCLSQAHVCTCRH